MQQHAPEQDPSSAASVVLILAGHCHALQAIAQFLRFRNGKSIVWWAAWTVFVTVPENPIIRYDLGIIDSIEGRAANFDKPDGVVFG